MTARFLNLELNDRENERDAEQRVRPGAGFDAADYLTRAEAACMISKMLK